jgi:hypothetical protein
VTDLTEQQREQVAEALAFHFEDYECREELAGQVNALRPVVARMIVEACAPENGEARLRAHADEDVILSAHRWVVSHFGGCYHRAAAFFAELAAPAGGNQ